MTSATPLPILVIAGDVTLDWNVADTSPSSTTVAWSGEQYASISLQPGGACLLASLAAAAIDADVRSIPTGSHPRPDDRRFHHSSAAWAPFPTTHGAREPVWRMNDYLGLARRDDTSPAVPEWSQVHDDPKGPDIVLLDDGGLGFNEDPKRWPSSIRESAGGAPRVVVLKTSDLFGRGALFRRLLDLGLERLVVVTTVDDVRRSGVEVSRGMSWEASAEDLARALSSTTELAPLAQAADVVVSFGAAGALVAHHRGPDGALDVTLVFDSREMEGTWEAGRPGGMIGGTTCLTVGVASALAAASTESTLVDGARRGLTALRALHETGFVALEPGSTAIRFPHEAVAAALRREPDDFATTIVPPANDHHGQWSILREHHIGGLDQLARQIVRLGPEPALKGMPVGRFGALLTADRREIEGFRSVQNLIAEYCALPRPPRPLSIAVFGPPGSGKSFAVTQIARSLHAGEVEKLTFNLSQLEGPDELVAAFHRVRDAGLSAHVPLVFWDEFDTALRSEPLDWLRHFLAPMQDGEFRDGQLVHPIGRAIFVFAGGTAERLDDLGRDLGRSDEERAARFRSVKGPDFLSRLRATVDILGPDPSTDELAADPEHVVRRAIVLQSLLTRTWPQLWRSGPDGVRELAVDPDVAGAFLDVRQFRHGVRSMESIVASSRLAREQHYHRSALPPATQLRLHVDDEEFLTLARRVPLDATLAERLAKRLHERFRTAAVDNDWGSRPPWDELSEPDRSASLAAVLDIPRKLATVGHALAPVGNGSEPDVELSTETIERLARLEHDRWIAERVAEGFSWADDDDAPWADPDLVPWDPMTEAERIARYPYAMRRRLGPGSLAGNERARNKDRLVVQAIPELLAAVGLRIVALHA